MFEKLAASVLLSYKKGSPIILDGFGKINKTRQHENYLHFL